jgi:methylenetetrahydrofolate dehydrogenase (NADP+) / methenyltetrahydrofolate cyclohydrolase
VGEDPASILYQNLKKKAAERIGAEVKIKNYEAGIKISDLIDEINTLNSDPAVNGIMIQLPLPASFTKDDRDKIIKAIALEKDVDGLRTDSKFIAPTAKAVLEVFTEALKVVPLKVDPLKVSVIGATGFEGKLIVKALNQEYKQSLAREDGKNKGLKGIGKIEVIELNSKTENLEEMVKNSDVVISVTGIPDLIKQDMVKEGAILIDVGAPKGDIEKKAYEKASFVSPVPGGVGPVTISCLLENLIKADQLL